MKLTSFGPTSGHRDQQDLFRGKSSPSSHCPGWRP
jgi:hypothetical protein